MLHYNSRASRQSGGNTKETPRSLEVRRALVGVYVLRVRHRAQQFSRAAKALEDTEAPKRGSINAEVAVGLPARDVAAVVVPLLALRFNEVQEDVLAERVANEIVLLQFIQRFAQARRQIID